MMKIIIFLDRKLLEANDDLLKSLTPGVLKGTGVFETMLFTDNQIQLLKLHLNRFKKGLKFYKLNPKLSTKQLTVLLYKILDLNNFKTARIRLAVWRKSSKTHISIVAQEINPKKSNRSIIISSIKHPNSLNPEIKSLNYSSFKKSFDEAKTSNAYEAILLNKNKKIVEGSRTTIFFIKNNILYTPSVKLGCLNGITRQLVLKCARKLGIKTKTGNYSLSDLQNCDEAFLTNSIIGITAISKCYNLKFNNKLTNNITKKIKKYYYLVAAGL